MGRKKKTRATTITENMGSTIADIWPRLKEFLLLIPKLLRGKSTATPPKILNYYSESKSHCAFDALNG
ncbi:MAG: hypothetical protein QME48_05855 [bacterium]|nr:hypothetical protein [bacterium]